MKRTQALKISCSILESILTFVENISTMSHEHKEAEQNEIGGPVLIAIFVVILVVLVIYFLG